VVSLPVVPPVPSLVVPSDVLAVVVVVVLAAVEWIVVVTLPCPLLDSVFVEPDVVLVVSALLARSFPFPSLDMSSSTALAQLASTTASEVPKNSRSRTFTEVSQNTKLRQA
jgi:hypothetical protein